MWHIEGNTHTHTHNCLTNEPCLLAEDTVRTNTFTSATKTFRSKSPFPPFFSSLFQTLNIFLYSVVHSAIIDTIHACNLVNRQLRAKLSKDTPTTLAAIELVTSNHVHTQLQTLQPLTTSLGPQTAPAR